MKKRRTEQNRTGFHVKDYIFITFILSIILLLSSCKKDDIQTNKSNVVDNTIPNPFVGNRTTNEIGNFTINNGRICFNTFADYIQTLNFINLADSLELEQYRSSLSIETPNIAYEEFCNLMEMATDSIEELYVISTFNNKVQFQAEDSSFTNKFLTNLEFANMNGEFKIGTSLCKEYNGYLLQVLDGDDSKMLNAMTTLETDTLNGVFATEIIVRGGNCHDGCPLLFTDTKTVDKSRLNIQYFIEPRFTYFSDPFSSGYY